MKATTYLYAAVSALILSGCAANTTGVTPSQNSNLQAVSPSGTAEAEKGAMQRALDNWLKEEWTPMTTATVKTTKSPDGKVVTTTAAAVAEPADETSFTLQKYADKWKIYHENEAKMKEGNPKDPSHIDYLDRIPVIGK